jgi:hypothetical protein
MVKLLALYIRKIKPEIVLSAQDRLNVVLLAAIATGSQAKISGFSAGHESPLL